MKYNYEDLLVNCGSLRSTPIINQRHEAIADINIILLCLLFFDNLVGLVEISPSMIAPVCQIGDQLELMCTTSGVLVLQSWQLISNPESGRMLVQLQQISSAGSSGVDSGPITINSTTFNSSRLSGPGNLPLITRMIISPVAKGLNGSQVRCVNALASEQSATTTIVVIGGSRPM